jgi:thiamine biosynthesis protein ThiS
MISETRCQIILKTMNVAINGQQQEIPEGQTIRGLLEWLKLDPSRVAVELDGRIVRQPDWQSRILASGARLEIVHFVGGG